MELDNKAFAFNQSDMSSETHSDPQIIYASMNVASDLSSSYDSSYGSSGEVLTQSNTASADMQEMTFAASEIQEISMDNNGNVTIKFATDEGQDSIVINDFAQFSDGVGCLTLSDGTEINTQALYTELCNDMGICTIDKPLAGDVLGVALETDKFYDLKFDINEGQGVERGSNESGEEVTLTFDDGAQIKFQTAQDLIEAALNGEPQDQAADQSAQGKFLSAMDVIEELIEKMEILESSGDKSPEAELVLAALEEDMASELAGLEPASGDELLESTFEADNDDSRYAMLSRIEGESAVPPSSPLEQAQNDAQNMEQAAQDLAGVEPAAGESSAPSGGASGGGFGFQSDFEAQGVIGIEDVGPIDPTKLQYGIEYNQDEYFPEHSEAEGIPQQKPLNDIPEISDAAKTLDETSGFDLSTSGTLVFDFGNDGSGAITLNSDITLGGSVLGGALYSNGQEVIIVQTNNGYEGKTPAGQSVFTLTLDPLLGDFTYTQHLPFDHADGSNPNDAILLDFGVQIADSNGDIQTSKISITVLDDAPSCVVPQTAKVDESNLSPDTSVSGQLDAHFGNDGAGGFSATGTSPASLTSEGQPVIVNFDATTNTYTGSAGGKDIFTLSLASDGTYNFVLSGTLDHPNASDPNDALRLDFGVRATDFDGDSVDGILTIKVLDDAPIAHNDWAVVDTAVGIANGNVIDNDELSADQNNTITEISFGGHSVTVDPVNGTSIDGDFGTLTIHADGSYSYALTGTGSGGGTTKSALNPSASDVAGTQESISKDGITISVANNGDYDLKWLNTSDGSGIGIDNLNSGDSPKVWPMGETFDIGFDKDAKSVTITIAEIGSNNDFGQHGVDFIVTLEDGTTVSSEQQFVPSEINNGTFSFTLNSSDFGGLDISSIALNSTNDGLYKGASFLLNNVTATYENQVDICDMFTYTLTDGDGDSSVANIKFNGVDAELIVGENIDDTTLSDTPHHIGGDDGSIIGTQGGDILIGDVGGTNTELPSQDYNFVFIVDVSGSMGNASDANSKISLLKAAVANTLNDLDQYQGGDVKVHITPFSTNVGASATFDLGTPDGLTQALSYLNALSGNGYTNYEAPMQEAVNWLQSSEPIGGNAITTTYFISDGEPNRYLNNAGNPQSGNAAKIIDEITGGDGTDEVGMLKSLSDEVIGVGIDVSSAISKLNIIDSDGTSINVHNPSDLDATLKAINPIYKLASVGDDTIEGGDGNDIIFGDSVNTDVLADDLGLSTPSGNGWDTFDRLENGESASNPSWSREDTTDYIRGNIEELAAESKDATGAGRQGGDDTLYGGAGDDIIYGQEGNDIINGGDGNDTLYGGSGADTFVMEILSRGVDVIGDFDVNDGDILDFSSLLTAYDPTQKAIDDFVFAREEGGATIISIDASGSGDAANAIDFVALNGLQNLNIQELVESGNINVF